MNIPEVTYTSLESFSSSIASQFAIVLGVGIGVVIFIAVVRFIINAFMGTTGVSNSTDYLNGMSHSYGIGNRYTK